MSDRERNPGSPGGWVFPVISPILPALGPRSHHQLQAQGREALRSAGAVKNSTLETYHKKQSFFL